MPDRKIRCWFRISSELKEQFDEYVRANHGTSKHSSGYELERAIRSYIGAEAPANPGIEDVFDKRMMKKLVIISDGLKRLPGYPNVKPRVLETMVTRWLEGSSKRTVSRYLDVVRSNSEKKNENGFIEYSVSKFCIMVGRLYSNTGSK